MLLIVGVLLIIGLIAAVTKTKWLPYPSFWLKALGLAVPVGTGAVAVFSLMSWQSSSSYLSWQLLIAHQFQTFSGNCSRGIDSIIDLVSGFNSSVLPISRSPVARNA